MTVGHLEDLDNLRHARHWNEMHFFLRAHATETEAGSAGKTPGPAITRPSGWRPGPRRAGRLLPVNFHCVTNLEEERHFIPTQGISGVIHYREGIFLRAISLRRGNTRAN